mmetsp:Transcript_426/g.1098  ORF Transcript_426/g.1098 Transcript_426/m.1098 type:complete len:224 (+) Transcript_426:1552-2223(+)
MFHSSRGTGQSYKPWHTHGVHLCGCGCYTFKNAKFSRGKVRFIATSSTTRRRKEESCTGVRERCNSAPNLYNVASWSICSLLKLHLETTVHYLGRCQYGVCGLYLWHTNYLGDEASTRSTRRTRPSFLPVSLRSMGSFMWCSFQLFYDGKLTFVVMDLMYYMATVWSRCVFLIRDPPFETWRTIEIRRHCCFDRKFRFSWRIRKHPQYPIGREVANCSYVCVC